MRCYSLFFVNDTATTEIYTLSLHDALPNSDVPQITRGRRADHTARDRPLPRAGQPHVGRERRLRADRRPQVRDRKSTRLNSSHANISYAVFCLKKKQIPL